ncbi:TatD family hydrolase [Campylobacter cuniculorum]|uniref:SsDNA/RNA exonuclease, 3'-5' specific n=2 Tax=Campylobacter cuniculorum TaxID=374106 RepID=A0A1W6BW50_9BACT|nr:TatD family hydrolase [Campylobacter cuniculorum]ARJ56318.1 ssDNA/RNA exonuclease, 3' - 5' specific [Campylobacter cuniculorum DSM 23162 = LMG 24588]QOR03807.1 TatD family hydrolase [Campylobacter cuniculorum]
MFLNLQFQNTFKIIDTHCHLDDESFYGDLNEMLLHAFENGIDKIIIPGADIKNLARAREIAHNYEKVFYAAGIHPCEPCVFDEELLKEHLKDEKCVAVGECGLDYYRLKSEDTELKKQQKEFFILQLELAKEFQKPVIIHTRDANEDTYEILKQYAKNLCGGVLHCFNASKHLLKLADEGFYFGIGGVLTFKNAKNLVEILPKIPKDKLLLETDAPYLTPEPFRGRRNDPLLTQMVANKMSELLNLSLEELLKLCFNNSEKLFFKGCQ